MRALICSAAFVFFMFRNAVADDVATGRILLSNGNVYDAREYLTRAYGIDSVSADVVLAYAAIVAGGSSAEKLYAAVEQDAGAAVRLRSEAALRLGDARYCMGEYDKAFSWYERAWRFDSSPDAVILQARAALAMGDAGKAEAVLEPAASRNNTPDASQALYYLARSKLAKRQYGRALTCFEKASRCTGCAHGSAALAGAIVSSQHLGDTRQMGKYRRILAGQDFTLESRMLNADSALGRPPDSAGNAGEEYTLQVGAFASLENARRLRDKLRRKFDDVHIETTSNGGATLHKVRIGSFRSEDEADAFGRKQLKSEGLTFKTVRK